MKKASVTSADSGFSSGELSLATSPSSASLRSMRRMSFSTLPSVIKTHYEVCEQIGTGTFGEVLSAFKLPPTESKVSIGITEMFVFLQLCKMAT